MGLAKPSTQKVITLVITMLLCAPSISGVGLAASEPASPDNQFVIHDDAGLGADAVARVRSELHKGMAVLVALGFTPRSGLLPLHVELMAGRGVSNSFRGRIVLFYVAENLAPVMHELAHLVAGYDNRLGHWSQEGFACFVQDRFGSNPAFPTYGIAHAVARLIYDRGNALPMIDVMQDRGRRTFFGTGTPWERWIAYVQSTSFTTWLVDTHGMEPFRHIYNRPVEDMDFAGIYGKPAVTLVAEWQTFLRAYNAPLDHADRIYDDIYERTHRRRLR